MGLQVASLEGAARLPGLATSLVIARGRIGRAKSVAIQVVSGGTACAGEGVAIGTCLAAGALHIVARMAFRAMVSSSSVFLCCAFLAATSFPKNALESLANGAIQEVTIIAGLAVVIGGALGLLHALLARSSIVASIASVCLAASRSIACGGVALAQDVAPFVEVASSA